MSSSFAPPAEERRSASEAARDKTGPAFGDVRRLDPILVDRIAAGEVVERPAAVVKELVENAIDAGARAIAVTIEAGGRRLVRVVDDGRGMSADDLDLAVERHATSKLADGDLGCIRTLGFRGEALPSIGAVAELSITTRSANVPSGVAILVRAGRKGPVRPVAAPPGTRIEVRDLFGATPARLKFLKSDRAEALAVAEILRRLAIAHPAIRISAVGEGLSGLDFPAEADDLDGFLRRAGRVLGPEFGRNAVEVRASRDDMALNGHAGLPTFGRGASTHIHFVVNGRPVRDKLLLGAVRGGYADVMASDRHPVLALALDCEPGLVDVNVHPAKTEVRFRDPAFVRGLVVSAIRTALAGAGHRAATVGGPQTLARMSVGSYHAPSSGSAQAFSGWQAPLDRGGEQTGFSEGPQASFAAIEPSARVIPPGPSQDDRTAFRPLGAARAQVHGNYIVAQTADGVVIVDAHAAHERLVYERLKRERGSTGIARQPLLIPQVVELDPLDAGRLAEEAEALAALGLVLEPFGHGAVLVREVPSALSGGAIASLVQAIADRLAQERDGAALVGERLDAILNSMSCHGSVRTGRQLRADEMNALLREMEEIPLSGQCNHGRPTYVELKLADIERLFGRR